MNLLRVGGAAGVELYDSDLCTAEEAKNDYLNQHGVTASRITHEFSCDAVSADELMKWIADPS